MGSFSALMGILDQSVPVFSLLILYFLVKHDRDFKHLKELLDNHITDTNKKIDSLTQQFNRLSERFDRLYEILIKDKRK